MRKPSFAPQSVLGLSFAYWLVAVGYTVQGVPKLWAAPLTAWPIQEKTINYDEKGTVRLISPFRLVAL